MFFLYIFIIIDCFMPSGIFGENINSSEETISKNIGRISYGKLAVAGQVPYQASLKSRGYKYYKSFCGAVVIANTKLLSAAHCISKKRSFCERLCKTNRIKLKPSSQYVAVAGSLRNSDSFSRYDDAIRGQWRTIKNATYPYNFKFPYYDIAIIFVSDPFVFNDKVNAIPTAVDFIDYKGLCTASGFGLTETKKAADYLRVAQVEVMSVDKCSKINRLKMNAFVCITGIVSNMDHGDSGGPLVCKSTGDRSDRGKGVLVGVVSGGQKGSGAFFTRVSSYKTFIETNSSHCFGTKMYLLLIICLVLIYTAVHVHLI